jgi:hypothetical protein
MEDMKAFSFYQRHAAIKSLSANATAVFMGKEQAKGLPIPLKQ